MLNKSVLLLLIIFAVSHADEYLVSIDLTNDRLSPLFDKNVKVLGEFENVAVLLIDTSEFGKISSYSFQIIDRAPEQGRYYMVHPLDPHLDVEHYGEILIKDGDDYLIKIKKNVLEELIKERAMLKRMLIDQTIFEREGGFALQQLLFNPYVQEIVDKVDPDSVLSHVQRLQDFRTRYSIHDSCFAAADYIAEKFTDYGCDSVFFQYHTHGHAPNVIGIKDGFLHPDSIYTIICGHFDAISPQPFSRAPGADDNASGTVSVIESARVMADHEFEYSVRYIAFSGEEWGLYGSEYYAPRARAQGDSILAVFNADMIGYVDIQPESLEVIAKISNPACEPLADFFIAAADTYTTLLTRKRMVSSMNGSDHAPFWQNGYVALCNIEDYWPVNPHYHSTSDTIGAGYNDNTFCTEVIKAHVAALSSTAIPEKTIIGVDEIVDSKPRNSRLNIYPTLGNSPFDIFFETDGTSTDTMLTIYDATGKRVKKLVFNSTILGLAPRSGAGFHLKYKVVWHGDDNFGRSVPTGVYFVQLGVGDMKHTDKVIVVR